MSKGKAMGRKKKDEWWEQKTSVDWRLEGLMHGRPPPLYETQILPPTAAAAAASRLHITSSWGVGGGERR